MVVAAVAVVVAAVVFAVPAAALMSSLSPASVAAAPARRPAPVRDVPVRDVLARDAPARDPASLGDAPVGRPARLGDAPVGRPAAAGDAPIGDPAAAGNALVGHPVPVGDALAGRPASARRTRVGRPRVGQTRVGQTRVRQTRVRLASARPGPARSGAEPAPEAFLWPVDAPLVDVFRAPPTPYGRGNRGIDFDTSGQPVVAAAPGEVVFAGAVGHTLHVVVQHAGGVRTSYSFLQEVDVGKGQRVERGDVVGRAGATLHFGVRVGTAYVDPLAFLGVRQSLRPYLVQDRDERPPSRR